MITGVRLHRSVVGCAVIVVALATSVPANADAVNILPPGRISSLVPSAEEVGVFTGLPMHEKGPLGQIPAPSIPLAQRDDCRVLVNDFSVDVWGSDFTAFRAQAWTYQPDPDRSFVSEGVATFQDAAGAQRARNVFSPGLFNACIHAQVLIPDANPGITGEIFDFKLGDRFVAWNIASKYQGRYTGYNCFALALSHKNVMAITGACQYGNPGQTVARLSDLVLDRIG